MSPSLSHNRLRTTISATTLLALVGMCGCGESARPVPATQAQTAKNPQETLSPEVQSEEGSPLTENVLQVAEVDEIDNVQAKPQIPKTVRAEATTAAAPAASDVSNSNPSSPQFDRLILFTPGGPLILEVDILVAGQPLAAAFEAIVVQAQAAADTDGNGRSTWSELLASPRFQAGEFGNLPFATDEEKKQMATRYDLDKDGLVDTEELPRFLTRNAGGSRPLSFRGLIEQQYLNRRDSPLWQQIDTDHNGSLDSEEIESLATSLQRRDENDDELLVPEELQIATVDSGDMPRRLRGIPAGMLLDTTTKWTNLQLALEQHYATGRELSRDDLPQATALFDHLDENQNGRIDRKEFTRVLNYPANVQLRLTLDDEAEIASPWEVVGEPSNLSSPVETYPDRLILHLPDCRLNVLLNDAVGKVNFQQQAEQLLLQYDSDANRYLEPQEVSEAANLMFDFSVLDADGNGKVFADELAALLERQQAALRCQVHVKGFDSSDAVFDWFDTNRDGRLDFQEIQAGKVHLQHLLGTGERSLPADQLPDSMLVVFARGNLENADALFVPPPPKPQTATTGERPGWFLGMDTNQDGMLSRREFIGTEEHFLQFDTNNDGYVHWDEITNSGAHDELLPTNR